MKRILWAIVLLFTFCINMKAGDETIGDWFCRVYASRDTLTILRYKGTDENIVVPNTIHYGTKDYKVTDIQGLMNSTTGTNRSIYISGNVRKYSGGIVTNKDCPPVIVFENGNFDIYNTGAVIPIETVGSSRFSCLIVLSSCNKSIDDLFSSSSSSTVNPYSKPGEIKITFDDGSRISVQMYLHNTKTGYVPVFNQERLEYLLFSLEKMEETRGAVKVIDLSGMPTNGAEITFNITDPSVLDEGTVLITTKGQLVDKADYTAPASDFNGLISYQRTNTQYWNSVCLPFAIKESDFPAGTSIYCLKEIKDNKVYLSRIEDGASVPAGVPCYIYCDSNTPWDIQIANGIIAANQAPVDQESDGWKLVGSFVNQPLGTGKYKLNSAGDAFVTTTQSSTVTAFRCYLAPVNPSTAPARLEVGVDEEAEITLVPDDREPQRMKLYDLMGRPRRENASGIFIRGK